MIVGFGFFLTRSSLLGIKQDKIFEQIASVVIWRIAAAMTKKGTTSSKWKTRVYFTAYCLFYTGYLFQARHLIIEKHDARNIKVIISVKAGSHPQPL